MDGARSALGGAIHGTCEGLFGSPVQPESAMDLAFQAKGEQLGPRTTKKILELFYGNHPVMAACLR